MLTLAETLSIRRHIIRLVLVCLSYSSLSLPAVDPYRPQTDVSGKIRVWGSTEMAGVLHLWEKGFLAFHKDAVFEEHLYGTASSIGGIYSGVADLSLLGRDIWPNETSAFESVFAYPPTGIQVATGSYDVPKATFALVVYVNKENPLGRLTLEQLAAIFGAPATPDAKAIRTWGELGLTGAWAAEPVHTYHFAYDNDKAIFFRRRVFAARYRWKDSTREFSNRRDASGSVTDSGELILQALAHDRYGIAVSNPHYANEKVKALALSETPGRYVFASQASVAARSYPLTRAIWIYLNRNPRKPYDPCSAEFLRYILSRQGQQDVTTDGVYLPLPANIDENESNEILRWAQ